MYYISLNTGLLFRTSQQWAWLTDANNREHLVHMNGTKPECLKGQIERPDAKGNRIWVDVTDFDCHPDAVVATWSWNREN
jgi:hypothetical protein